MKKLVNYCSIILLLLLATSQVKAQSVDVVIRENGTERKESIDLPMSMTYPLDSLLNDWKAKNYIDLGKDCSTAEVNPLFSDSVYMDRLSRIPAIMEMPYNDIVRKFIDMYAGRLRNQVSFMLSACNFYMPIFEEALDAYGLPLELKYLPIIESALNPPPYPAQALPDYGSSCLIQAKYTDWKATAWWTNAATRLKLPGPLHVISKTCMPSTKTGTW